MPVLHQYDYLFAIGTLFAALDAYNIGANDVANSFATSVASKSLTLRQACLAAAVMEFLGAVLVGARVADTIKNGIISSSVFQASPDVQMLAFVCAITASASWLMFATRMSWPVSTTYSIVSAVAGVGVATGGANSVRWGWNGGKGLATIFAGFGIAPALAAGFAAIVYLLVKFCVLARRNASRWAIFTGPLVFFTVAAIMTMSIIYKGAPSLGLNKLAKGTTALAIVMTALVVAALSALFWVPFVWCKVIRKDYTLRFYHFFMGPALWWRKAPEDAGAEGVKSHVPDYRVRKDEVDATAPALKTNFDDEESSDYRGPSKEQRSESDEALATHPAALSELEKRDEHPIEGSWIKPKNLWIILRYKVLAVLTHGTSVDVHSLQAATGSPQEQRMREMYARAAQYDNEVEHTYSFVQVLTACTASFAHGANDLGNAVGPFAVIYHVWSTGTLSSSKTPVPVWILAVGAIILVIGLATYGYNIMRALGNKLTLHSPSRGFSMELGAAITVILASQYGLPVSTTMCITGATLGVALCNGDLKAVNWRAFGWIFLGWVITVPVVGTLAGCLMGIILNAPHFQN